MSFTHSLYFLVVSVSVYILYLEVGCHLFIVADCWLGISPCAEKALLLFQLRSMAEETEGSLKYTPTWAVAVVCTIFVTISLLLERGIHRLGKVSQRRCPKELIFLLDIYLR